MSVTVDRTEDLYTVFKNWHDNLMDSLTHLHNESRTPDEQEAYGVALALAEDLPIKATFTIDEEVMDKVSLVFEDEDDDDEDNEQEYWALITS